MTDEIFHSIYWNEKYVTAKHVFDTTRKSGEIVKRLAPQAVSNPSELEEAVAHEITAIFDPDYIAALLVGNPVALAESNGFAWCSGIWDMALASTTGVVAAAYDAFEEGIAGSLSSGIHHATLHNGEGFCTLNAFAVVAKHFHEHKILILDFDAHNGGGTVSCMRELGYEGRVRQFDISTNTYDRYKTTEHFDIFMAWDDQHYLSMVDTVLGTIRPNDVDLILYNAGTDPFPTISHETMAERDRRVFEFCTVSHIPCAYVLAGGYTWHQDMGSLVDSHMSTIKAAEENWLKQLVVPS